MADIGTSASEAHAAARGLPPFNECGAGLRGGTRAEL